MANIDQISALDVDGTEQISVQETQAVEATVQRSKQTEVVAPGISISDFKSTVEPVVVPDSIEQQGLASFNRRVQSQVRNALAKPNASERTAPISTLVPGLSNLSTLEQTAASSASTGPSFISGTNGADLLAGTQVSDVILAKGGDDVVIALNGSDLVRGGNGDDTLVGGGDRDFLFGGRGSDLIFGDTSDGLTFGAVGNDEIDGGAGDDSIFGGGGNDLIRGGSGGDLIEGEDGNDRLNGGAGTDFINGGKGRDRIFGGADTDFLFGGRGKDTINADAGDDVAFGEGGRDTVFGGAGNDELSGGGGDDTVIGGIGDDRVSGDRGNDILIGVDSEVAAFGFGRDEIDRLRGGRGRDTFVLGNRGQVFYDDGDLFGVGQSDYAVLEDFKTDGTDKIQLAGSADDYILFGLDEGNVLGLPTGTEISKRSAEGVSEIIGVVANVSVESLDLNNGAQFSFVG